MSMTTLMRPATTALLAAMALLVGPAARADEPTIDDQLEQYWGKVRQPSVQKRLYAQKGRHEGTLFTGVVPNDSFFVFVPLGARYNWYPIEDLALEFGGAYNFEKKDDLQKFLEKELREGGEGVLPQRLMWDVTLGVVWTPLRGKVGAFNAKLGHFDFGLAAGLAVLGTQLQRFEKDDPQHTVAFGGYLGATLRFYFTSFFALRVDYRHFLYGGKKVNEDGEILSNGVAAPAEITFGLSFFSPAP